MAPQGQGRGQGRGGGRGPRTRKVVLAWADTRNGIAQHDSVSHALAVIERLGYETGMYDTYIRTDSNIVAKAPLMTTGQPASGGPNLGMMVLLLVLALASSTPLKPLPAHVQQPAAQQTPTPENRPMTEAESAALPEGDGRDAVAFMCVPCHGVLVAIAQRKTPLAWNATVEDMRVKGAKGSDEQAEAATKYLSRHFAAVDVNTATAALLAEVAGFTAAEAAAITAYRSAGHAFESFTDLRKVPGLDPKRLTAAKPRVAYAPK